jgi:Tfp pilus assembly protein PilO
LKKKRYLVLALFFVCSVYLFETYFLAPSSEQYREALAKEYKMLMRYENAVKGAGATEEEIQSLIADMKNTEKRLLAEQSDFLASAKMQGEISDLTRKAGLNVATIRPMSPVKLNTYNVIQLYFEGNGNIKQMSDFLKLIDENPMLLKIDKMSLNITNLQMPSDLKFKIQISGLRKP